jgi:hypothetical protein
MKGKEGGQTEKGKPNASTYCINSGSQINTENYGVILQMY